MLLLAIAGMLLFLAFMLHVLWWRIKFPVHTTNTLLLVFFATPLFIYVVYIYLFPTLVLFTISDIVRLILFYGSCALVYIILYSAIQQQSPTLAMVLYLYSKGKTGCDEDSLILYLSATNEIQKRFSLMEQGKWIFSLDETWYLTKKGLRAANFFEYSALVFGLKVGG